MALVTVQRSPSPSHSGNELDDSDALPCSEGSRHSGKQKRSRAASLVKRCINSMRFISRIRFSESYFTVKGAALILPNAEACRRKVSKAAHAGDMQNHLQAMCHLLRPQDTIQVAVKLESVYTRKRTRYFVVVSCFGRQDTEESVVLGIDCIDETKSATVGLVLPVWANTRTSLNGDGGFTVWTANDRTHIFKPVTVQAMWSGLHILHKVCDNANSCCYVPAGLTHTWIGYYESKLVLADPVFVGEWNMSDDIIAAVLAGEGSIPVPPTVNEVEVVERQIRSRLREIMIRVDLEDVTSVYLREQLEAVLGRSLKEYRSFIDAEMIVVMGQLDSPSRIFEFLFLGSEWNASNLDELNKNGIGFILNVTKEIDNFFPGLFKYHNVRVHDTEDTDLLKYWESTHKFICHAINASSKVLVHCKMGVSRSASTVIAFAMKQYNWSYEKAHDFVLARRSVVRPNDGFRHQLQLYEGILKASNQRHSDLWRSKSESNLKVQLQPFSLLHGHQSTCDQETASLHSDDCEHRSAEKASGNERRSCNEERSPVRRQSHSVPVTTAAALVPMRPRSWSSQDVDKRQGVLAGTKSASCLAELDDRTDEDEVDSSSSSVSSETEDAFSGEENSSKRCQKHHREYDLNTGSGSPTALEKCLSHEDSDVDERQSFDLLEPSMADRYVNTPQTCNFSILPSDATIPDAVGVAATSRPCTLGIFQRPESDLPSSARAQPGPGSSWTPTEHSKTTSHVPVSAKLANFSLVTAVGVDKAAESSSPYTKRLSQSSSPCGIKMAACVAVPLVKGSSVPATQCAADTICTAGVSDWLPVVGKEGLARLQAVHFQHGAPSQLPPQQQEECILPCGQAPNEGAGSHEEVRSTSHEGIWKRYALEDIPWSPGAVRRQKDMLECARVRTGEGSAAESVDGRRAACGYDCVETDVCACQLTPKCEPSNLAAPEADMVQPAPGTVKKVRKEIEDRLVADDGGALSCTVQRSASLKGLPLTPGKSLPAALQRSASVRERGSADCCTRRSTKLSRPTSTLVASSQPPLEPGMRAAASRSGTDLQHHETSVRISRSPSDATSLSAVTPPAERGNQTCFDACATADHEPVKFLLGGGRLDGERRSLSGSYRGDCTSVRAVSMPFKGASAEPRSSSPLACEGANATPHQYPRRFEVAAAAATLKASVCLEPDVHLVSEAQLSRFDTSRCTAVPNEKSSGFVSCPTSSTSDKSRVLPAPSQATPAPLKHASSVKNLVYIFEASWRNSWSSGKENGQQSQLLSPAAQRSPLLRTQSFSLPRRRCGIDHCSPLSNRFRHGHSFNWRTRFVSCVSSTHPASMPPSSTVSRGSSRQSLASSSSQTAVHVAAQ